MDKPKLVDNMNVEITNSLKVDEMVKENPKNVVVSGVFLHLEIK